MYSRRGLICGLAGASVAAAQQAQNPSPMVEHTRPHPRLTKPDPPLPGQRHKLAPAGTLFIPQKLVGRRTIPLFVHFHGGPWIPEVAATRRGMAAISIDTGSGSGVYARQFADRRLFATILREAETAAQAKLLPVTLTAWSAGHGAIREILAVPEYYGQVSRVILLDGLHTGYEGGKPGPLESRLEPNNLETFLRFARDAATGQKRMTITHSEIFPGTFASTTETADWLLSRLGLRRATLLRKGPMGTQQLSEVRRSGLLLFGYAGNSAPDHVDQLHALDWFLR